MVATDANARTTNAADKLGLNSALRCAFSGGAVMGFTTVGLGLFGLIILLVIMVNSDASDNEATQYIYAAENLAAFGFGASSIAFSPVSLVEFTPKLLMLGLILLERSRLVFLRTISVILLPLLIT